MNSVMASKGSENSSLVRGTLLKSAINVSKENENVPTHGVECV